jgi:23S rRNA pseudouridine2605 synthase
MRKNPASGGRKSDKEKTYKKSATDRKGNDAKPFKRSEKNFDRSEEGDRKPYSRAGGRSEGRSTTGGERGKRPYSGRTTERSDDQPKRPYSGRSTDKFNKEERPKRFDDREKSKRPYSGSGRSTDKFNKEDRPKRFENNDRPKRFSDSNRPTGKFNKEDRPKRFEDADRPKRFSDSNRSTGKFNKEDRPKRFEDSDRPKRPSSGAGRPANKFGRDDREKRFDDEKPKRRVSEDKPMSRRKFEEEDLSLSFSRKNPVERKKRDEGDFEERKKRPAKNEEQKPFERKVSGPFRKKFKEDADKFDREERAYKDRKSKDYDDESEVKEMTLNKYISHSSTSSRRDAAELVKQGKVKVNGELMLDPGYRVQQYDEVTIAGKKLVPQKNRVYVLLNKPKGYITTTEDPEGRDTVMELVIGVGVDKLFPVGRLDRNTTGLLLLTNDGDLAQKLSHPSFETKKVYQVSLNKALTKADFDKIVEGLELEDGPVKVDALAYLDEKTEIGIEIHSGRNRIVRRIFESLGYEVEKLDRMMYAGLTKKNLPRGKWRLLSEKEVIVLKHFKN